MKRGGLAFTSHWVQTEDDFKRELQEFAPDIIISDFALPHFDGMTALALSRDRRPRTPFIFVSGTMGEEAAVGALQQGATDYLLKGQTRRLCRAVERAITEARQRADRQKLEEQLRQAQKMEAIGQLAGGIAHDFNNLVTAILGFADLTLARLSAGQPAGVEDVQQIRTAGERAAEMTRQLLAFSRKQVINPRVLDLNALVRNIERMLKRIIGEQVDLRTVLADGIGRVRADPNQLEQVILNLSINAREAMGSCGVLTIETADVMLDETYTRSHGEVEPGPYVMLVVTDSGEGMTPETMSHLFEPFFTTKPQGQGTGLGLATVYGIVKQSGGSIWVYSEPGRGTTFKIYLPRVTDAAHVATKAATIESVGGSETILVVEDDELVRRLIVLVLRARGYCVLESGNGADALLAAARHPRRIDLVVSDVVMPRMGGPGLVKELRERQPRLKVLFLSGYTKEAVVHDGTLDKGLAFLQKPFTAEGLLARVRETLNTRDT